MVSSLQLPKQRPGPVPERPAEMLSESLRLPFGDNNVLGFYLDLVAKDADEHDWTSDALRLVGNTCADLGSSHDKISRSPVTDVAIRRQQGARTCEAEATSLASSLDRGRQGRYCPWGAMQSLS